MGQLTLGAHLGHRGGHSLSLESRAAPCCIMGVMKQIGRKQVAILHYTDVLIPYLLRNLNIVV